MQRTSLGALVALLLMATGASAAPGADLDVHAEVEAEIRAPALPEPVPRPSDSEPMAPAFPFPVALPPEVDHDVLHPFLDVDWLETTRAHVDAGTSARAAPVSDASGTAHVRGAVSTLLEPLPPAVERAAPPALAAAGLLALLQAFGGARLVGSLGGFALYSRLAKSELLDNAHRDAVYKFIQQQPGMAVTELSERSGLGWGTTVYHLERLEKAGFVTSERAGLQRCYFPVGAMRREERAHIGALKADTTRSIAEFLVSRPGASQSDLCLALGLSASQASKQVSKLETAGLVRRERDWKTVHLHPEPALSDLMGGPMDAAASSVASPIAA